MMTRLHRSGATLAIASICVAVSVHAVAQSGMEDSVGVEPAVAKTSDAPAAPEQVKRAATRTSPTKAPAIKYRPPYVDKPNGLTPGGTRGTEVKLAALFALVPKHTGRTIRDRPTLYWYLSKPVENHRIAVTVVDDPGDRAP